MKRSTAELIAIYTADCRHPPYEVVQKAKLHIADTLACIYAGTGTDAVRILAEANHWKGAPDDIFVPGWGFAKTLDGAAMLLGTAAHAHDFDDTYVLMPGHPSAPIVAALLTTILDLSKNYGKVLDGIDFIHAYVKGMEVACKVGEIISDDHTDQGWHNISTVCLLGAAVACGTLRGLDAIGSERALAIACSQAGGILNNSGTMVKPLHCGLAARAGYMSAALAERHFTAGVDILAGDYGFIHAFTGGRRSEIELPFTDMSGTLLPPLTGTHFALINPGVEVKRYPCCQVAHTCIDGMRAIRERQGFDIDGIERIIGYVSTEKRMTYLQCPDPQTPTEARFSMNFAVATTMQYGTVTLDHFNSDILLSEYFRRNMRRVEMRLKGQDDDDADIEVIFSDGRRMKSSGSYEDVNWDDVVSKFNTCMRHAFKPENPTPILVALEQLDKIKDLSRVFLREADAT